MNKQYILGFTAILIAGLILSPGIAGANSKTPYIVPGVCENISAKDARKILEKNDAFLLDVRTPNEFNYSHIEGAKLIPLRTVQAHDPVILPDDKLLKNRLNELPKNKLTKIVVYCYSGKRGWEASQMIATAGYKRVYNIQNGLPTWVNEGYPVVIDSAKWAASYPHYV